MTVGAKVPAWYWVVALLATAWEAIGCLAFFMQVRMGPAELGALPKAQADLFGAMPAWHWAVYGIAVFAGLLGGIGLLVRRRFAVPLLGLSLLAAVIQFAWTFLATPILSIMPAGEALGLPIAILVIGLVLLWFARFAAGKGWLA